MTVLLALHASGATESSAREVAAEHSLPVRSFSSLSEVLTAEGFHPPSCLVAGIGARDLRSQVVEHLRATRPALSMVFVAPNLAPDAIFALVRAGAVDVLGDAIDPERVKRAVREGLDRSRAIAELSAEEARVTNRFGALTHRETQVLHMIARGHSSKSAAVELEISKRTVDYHRRQIMLKTSTRSATELIDLAHRGELLQYRRQARIHGLPPVAGQLGR